MVGSSGGRFALMRMLAQCALTVMRNGSRVVMRRYYVRAQCATVGRSLGDGVVKI